MLFKHSTTTARSARFLAGETGVARAETAITQESDAPRQPSRHELEIERLTDKIAALQEQLDAQAERWDAELAEASERARSEAAEQHVRDDAKANAALIEALDKARLAFETGLGERAAQLGTALAHTAVSRLVTLSADESDWLDRLIARRVAELRAGAVVALHLAPRDLTEERKLRLREALPAGTELVADPDIPAGTARLALRLGAVAIDPGKGLEGVMEAIDAGQP